MLNIAPDYYSYYWNSYLSKKGFAKHRTRRHRNLVEIAISLFKRLFGDSVAAKDWDNIVHELNLKAMLYNKMLQVQREAIANA